jgi:hypothetical protein
MTSAHLISSENCADPMGHPEKVHILARSQDLNIVLMLMRRVVILHWQHIPKAIFSRTFNVQPPIPLKLCWVQCLPCFMENTAF